MEAAATPSQTGSKTAAAAGGDKDEYIDKTVYDLQFTNTIRRTSFIMNLVLTALLLAEVLQYTLPTESVVFYFIAPKYVRVIMYTHMISLYVNFTAFIYNFIFNVCSHSGHVQRSKLRTYIIIMVWCLVLFVFRIIWEMMIQDYRWLANMNKKSFSPSKPEEEF